MSSISVLDCTLRDGGYCNQWRFGFDNACKITENLVEAGIDIIECGFITNKADYNPDVTKYTDLSQISKVIPESRSGRTFVAMMNYGEYDVDILPPCDHTSIDGIRVAYHKKNRREALELCKKIKEKGYLIFIQAMVSLSYTDEEFLDMIKRVNELEPYSFYIVDSFGEMKKNDLTRLYYLLDHNLKDSIKIGFHSHNNMQLAYSNAQTLVDMHSKRGLIIDSSVYGMGRGAGNLSTELFVGYLNDDAGKNYDIKPLLTIIDHVLNDFYQQNYWGYSLPNYISASHHAHPNYAVYLDDKKTLTVESMNSIFDMMDEDKKVSYDKQYIEELYSKFMETGKAHEQHRAEIKELLEGKTVLIIAPGMSSVEEKEKIIDFGSKENVVTVSVNYDYPYLGSDYIFLSNLRRYRELPVEARSKCIVTSNIPADGVYMQTKYRDLLSDNEAVADNAGLMAVKFMMMGGRVKSIYLAGFDGYAHDIKKNYGDQNMSIIMKNAVWDAINIGMTEQLTELSRQVEIKFLTMSRYIKIEGTENMNISNKQACNGSTKPFSDKLGGDSGHKIILISCCSSTVTSNYYEEVAA